MNKYKLMKRMLAIVLSAAMVFTNIGHTPTVAYAASGNSVDFMVSGADFVAAIEDMIYSGAEPLKQEELDFTNGKAEKYYQFFFDGEEPLYEFYPEFDGQDMEAEVRVLSAFRKQRMIHIPLLVRKRLYFYILTIVRIP